MQVLGHGPSAIDEGSPLRSIDALHPDLTQIERFILDKAGMTVDAAKATVRGPRVAARCVPGLWKL